jgi:ATP-dependent RNA helicase DeaD
VATDVAARGLDLPDLGLVIHAEIPVNKATLLHRSGRTGRAGKKGTSVLMVSHTRRRKVELMLRSANIEAEWSGPPSADEIRAKDQERMLTDPVLTAPADEDSLEMGRKLLERSSPEQVAAALIRLYREKLPPPEDVQDDARMARTMDGERGRREREPVDFARDGDMSWFRINVGREKNADPKWLLPLICRLGHVTKRDVGSIKIFDRETKFEITQEAEAKFRAAIAKGGDDDVTISDAVAPAPGEKTARPKAFAKPRREFDGPKKPWTPRPERTAEPAPAPADGGKPKWVKRTKDDPTPAGKKPWVEKPRGDKKPWAGKPKPYQAKAGGKPFKGKPKV